MAGKDRTAQGSVGDAFVELVEIVHRLRAPGGCPWDREQTAATLKPFVIEEAYEVLEAIDHGDSRELAEELGDLLLQVVLQAEIGAEKKSFAIEDVVRGISKKLIRRHPHVFGDLQVQGSGQVLANWEEIKKTEKRGCGLFSGLPAELPALQRAARMGEKAGRVGFDWSAPEQVRAKVVEELGEVDGAVATGQASQIEHEIGDLLFAVAQWARHLGQLPEEALRGCCQRFAERFAAMEHVLAKEDRAVEQCSMDELEALWQRVKKT